jgi:thymidylate synthase ThyX
MTETGSPLRVYTLDGLPPEVTAVAFARTSRVPGPFDEIARELTQARASRFHEKWVLGYGHSSVAEHAVLSIAIENVSILGAKVVEENRLSSFTERSTRYQVLEPGNHYTPPCFASGEPGRVYRAAIGALYSAYTAALPAATAFCERKYAAPGGLETAGSPAGKACDAVRGLLPAAAKTNLGWTVNARSLAHALVKMRSHPLAEMRGLARSLAEVARERVPTLLRHAEPSPYLTGWERRLGGSSPVDASSAAEPGARLVAHDPHGEALVAAAILFRAVEISYGEARRRAESMSDSERGVLLSEALRGIGGHEAPVREFESTAYTFEIVCDFGAYRDIQRHRMSTQTQQTLGCSLGYEIPGDAREAGVGPIMERALADAREAWAALAEVDPDHAQYVVPLAFRKRFLMTMNYREAYQLVRLRSREQGHEAYRRIARAIRDEIERVHPALGRLIPTEACEPATAAAGGV